MKCPYENNNKNYNENKKKKTNNIGNILVFPEGPMIDRGGSIKILSISKSSKKASFSICQQLLIFTETYQRYHLSVNCFIHLSKRVKLFGSSDMEFKFGVLQYLCSV